MNILGTGAFPNTVISVNSHEDLDEIIDSNNFLGLDEFPQDLFQDFKGKLLQPNLVRSLWKIFCA